MSFFLQQALVSIWRYSISSLSLSLMVAIYCSLYLKLFLANLLVCVCERWLSGLVYLS